MPTGGNQQIANIDPGFWFSPLAPVKPMAPANQRPRQWGYQPGANLIWQPKGDEFLGFWILREFADSCDLLRLVLETVKDRLCAMKWEIRLIAKPGETQKNLQARQTSDPRIAAIRQFFLKPDGINAWSKWLRMFLEDVLVIDAGAIYKERDLKGKIASLRVIDGATINRCITDQGFTPMSPSVAYQQVLYGIPAFDLTTDDMTYVMRNPRTWKRYGFSPVEQNLTHIGIALRRQQFLSDYYTSGNIPEAMCFLPSDLPIDRVKEIQDWFDSVLAGDLAKRRRLTFLPGYGSSNANTKPNVIFPKEALLKDPLDEWLFQMFCYNLGTTPQAMLRMMNRATAQQSAESSEEEGLEPKANDIAEVMNGIIQVDMGFDDCEFAWVQRREVDAQKQMEIDTGYVGAGIISRNQSRENMGLDPDPSPEADKLMVTTPTGLVPVDSADQLQQLKDRTEATQPPESDDNQPPKGKKKPKPKPAKKVSGAATDGAASIDPSHATMVTREAQSRIEKVLQKVFRHQREKAVEDSKRLMKLRKDDDPKKTPEQIADELYAAIVSEFTASVPETSAALESAALEGVSRGILQIEISDAALIGEVNSVARDWAHERAAELVGRKYDAEGNLVDNPNAQWAISDTTRNELRQLVEDTFTEEAPVSALADAIQTAGAFSDARATMVARTEVVRAQTQGNWEIWKSSGLIKTVRWQVGDDDPCPLCEENDDEIRPFGEAFPSGALMPQVHPNCACILVADSFNE